MSNEMKEWLWDKYGDVVLEAGAVDTVIQVIPLDNFYGVVHGLKDGRHVKYEVWLDDDDGFWHYKSRF